MYKATFVCFVGSYWFETLWTEVSGGSRVGSGKGDPHLASANPWTLTHPGRSRQATRSIRVSKLSLSGFVESELLHVRPLHNVVFSFT